MEVRVLRVDRVCTLTIEGRIDTYTAPHLEKVVGENLEDCDKMIFDFTDVEYISSAGIRVLLYAQREMIKKDGVVVKNVRPKVASLFTITGMPNVLTIE